MTTRARGGFSLVEMLIVLVILGVAAGAVAPAIRDLRAADPLQAATSEATTLLARTRRTALERAVPMRLSIDARTHRYSVRALAYGAVPDSITSDSLPLDASVSLDGRDRRIVIMFAPTGEARGDTVVLRWRGRVAAVSADQWTGEPRVASN